MTISAGSIKHIYNANGVTRDWDYTFPINTTDGSDIKLYKTAIGGAITEITANYSVDVVNRKVTYPTVASGLPLLATGEKITLLRNEPLSQNSDWVNKGPFNSETVELALDKLTMIAQEQNETLSRAVKYPIDQTPTSTATDTFLTTIQASQTAAEAAKVAAQAAQTAAEAAKVAAQASQAAAATSATNAAASATAAQTAQTAAETAKTAAEAAKVAAVTAKNAAEAAQAAGASSASSAATSATNAAASATAAANSASAAATSATNAANTANASQASADQAAIYAAALKATSTSSLLIGIGSKTFVTQSGKQFAVGQYILIVDTVNSANYMHGQVTSYTGTTLVVDVQNTGGSGTIASWNIYVSGSRGTQGPSGSIPIATAGGGTDTINADYTPDITLSNLTLVAFVATAANATTTPTFAPDGLTPHTITKQGGAALLEGDIPGAGAVCIVEYNLANTRWELLNPAGAKTAANLSGTPALPNGVTATTQAAGDNSTKVATTGYVDVGLNLKAPTSDPTFATKITTPEVIVNAAATSKYAVRQGTSFSVAAGAIQRLPLTLYRGFIYITESSISGAAALIISDGVASTTLIVGQIGTLYTNTKDTASKVNIYIDNTSGGSLSIQNNTTINPVVFHVIGFMAQ